MEPLSACIKGCALFGSAEKGHICPNCDQQTKKRDLDDDEPATAAESTIEKPVGTKRPFYFPRDAKVVPFSGFDRRETTATTAAAAGTENNSFFSGKSFRTTSSSSSSGSSFFSSVDSGFFPTRGRSFDPSTFTFGFGSATDTTSKTVKKEDKNCGSCRRRVGLLGFKCRCKKLFCSKHRYPEEHRCSFDYKGFGRRILEQQNPAVDSDKLENRV
ncbi:unnamed protein product [Linum tenue]|uniref:AN1-type domain-containing protein n=1 Tax=Linum tenue TaxID=586396 RepID=A0AAV0J710_9ROSI|nr:unnamed protein product [Linum tenue]